MGILSNFRKSFHNIFFRRILFGVVTSVSVFISSWDHLDRTNDKYKATYADHEDSFDFIIIGSGTAGSVVANRLSENFKVLLLEAGGEPHPFQEIPNFSFALLNYPEVDYMHKTVPQKHSCFAMPYQQAGWSAGKSLGGTSNVNFMIHLRGHPKDFDYWSFISKSPDWSYKEVLYYFKKMENYKPGNRASQLEYHGKGGPLNIEIPDYKGMAKEWVEGGVELGYDHVDLNGYFHEGFDAIYHPLDRGRRLAVFGAYLNNIRKRSNLFIYKYSHVNKILFRGPNHEAYAVKYHRHGKKKIAFAKKEIILSAGAISSPKLLMLSGIGPHEHLKKIGIPVLSNLPVGQNLQDHLSTYLGPFTVKKGKSFILDRDVNAEEFSRYAFGKGVLTSSHIHGAAELVSSHAKKDGEGDWPDILLFLAGLGTHQNFPQDVAHAFGIREDICKAIYGPFRGKDSFLLIVSNGRPKSRGEITLKDSNPYSEPVIDPRYLSHPQDLKVMIEGIRVALQLAENTTAFQSVNTRYSTIPFPGCEHYPFRSDAYFECHIRSLSVTLHHIVGTCAMGSEGSPFAVVDSQLRVFGVKGLRVIDASIQPTVVVTNTMASTIMIGEKGADMIKKFWLHDSQDSFKNPYLSHLINDLQGYNGNEDKYTLYNKIISPSQNSITTHIAIDPSTIKIPYSTPFNSINSILDTGRGQNKKTFTLHLSNKTYDLIPSQEKKVISTRDSFGALGPLTIVQPLLSQESLEDFGKKLNFNNKNKNIEVIKPLSDSTPPPPKHLFQPHQISRQFNYPFASNYDHANYFIPISPIPSPPTPVNSVKKIYSPPINTLSNLGRPSLPISTRLPIPTQQFTYLSQFPHQHQQQHHSYAINPINGLKYQQHIYAPPQAHPAPVTVPAPVNSYPPPAITYFIPASDLQNFQSLVSAPSQKQQNQQQQFTNNPKHPIYLQNFGIYQGTKLIEVTNSNSNQNQNPGQTQNQGQEETPPARPVQTQNQVIASFTTNEKRPDFEMYKNSDGTEIEIVKAKQIIETSEKGGEDIEYKENEVKSEDDDGVPKIDLSSLDPLGLPEDNIMDNEIAYSALNPVEAELPKDMEKKIAELAAEKKIAEINDNENETEINPQKMSRRNYFFEPPSVPSGKEHRRMRSSSSFDYRPAPLQIIYDTSMFADRK